MAAASLILGIVAFALSLFSWTSGLFYWAALSLGVIGVILSILGRKCSVQHDMATAGLVLSIIAVSLALVFMVSCYACKACVGLDLETMTTQLASL